MTSTNDGKDVKSNQIGVQKAKTYYIELYKNLDARLSAESDLEARVSHLCEAWRRVHSLCQHSAPTTHPHLISWLKRHTAHTLLQSEWRLPKNQDKHQTLDAAIDVFLAECHKATASRHGAAPDWEVQLLQRAQWFKSVIPDPWGNAVLKALLGLSDASPGAAGSPTDHEIIQWLREERGVFFVTRLRQLGTSKCNDLALKLASAVMERARACAEPVADTETTPQQPDQDTTPKAPTFTDVLSVEAGFTADVWELITDIEFVLLYKDRSKCIAVAKQTGLGIGYQLVERLNSRLELSPREKRLWKNSKDVAILIAQVMLARCMVVPSCTGTARSTLYFCSRSLVRLLPAERLPAAMAALAAPAATARHLHTLAVAVHAQCKNERKPFVCELYIRAITAGMNELERLKLNKDKEEDARAAEQLLGSWFTQLGSLLGGSARLAYECALTAFSLHPSATMYELIRAAPQLQPHPAHKDVHEPEPETNSEYGSWATDSRSQTNFVKTSETLNLKKTQQHSNVLSTAVLNEGETLGLSPELCQDLIVLLSGPRVKTLSWDMDKEILIENCRSYMERTHGGTKALTTELKYLNLHPDSFLHLPEEEDQEEGDIYYGIEKGYEHLVELQDPEEIWEDAPTDLERTESCYTTDDEALIPIPRRKKKVRRLSDTSGDEETDPLSQSVPKPKPRSHSSEGSKERSKERRKDGSKERKKKEKQPRERSTSKARVRKDKEKLKVSEDCDPLTIDPDKPQTKQKKERKKKEKKDPQKKIPTSSALSRLIGKKVIRRPALNTQEQTRVDVETEFNNQLFITDSDYDSQGKSSIASMHTDGNDPDVLFDGLFSMDEIKSPEKYTPKTSEQTNAFGLDKATFSNRGLNQNAVHASNYTVKPNRSNTNIHEQTRPLSATPLSMRNISDVSRSPSRASLSLPQSKVKLSIKRLIEFRKQKSASDLTSATKMAVQPQYNRSILNKKMPNKYELPNSAESGSRSIQSGCPKAISVPSIPKIYINKEQSEQLNILKSGVDSLLNKSTNVGLESFPMKNPMKKSETGLNNEVSNSKSVKLSRPVNTHLNKVENKIFTAPNQSESVKVTNNDITSKLVHQSNMKSNPPWQNAANTDQSNLHDFLKELHRSINAGVSKEVTGLKIQKYVPPSTPVNYCSKQIKQPKKVENAPNTFARLNYMHKNKQGESVAKQNYDQVTQNKSQKSSNAQFVGDKCYINYKIDPLLSRFENTTIRKVEKTPQRKVYSANNNPHLTRMLNSNQSVIKKTEQAEDKLVQPNTMTTQPTNNISPPRTTMLTESDQDQLRLLLRQQNKLNISRPQIRSEGVINKGAVNLPKGYGGSTSSPVSLQTQGQRSVEDIHNNLQGCPIYNRPNQDLQVPIQNVAAPQPRIPNIVQTTEKPAASNIRHKNSAGNTKEFTKNPKDENNSEPQDWEKVLNALLSHKTPSRGQNALDMVLKKDSNQTSSNSLREQRLRNVESSRNLEFNITIPNTINRKRENPGNNGNSEKHNLHVNQRKPSNTVVLNSNSSSAVNNVTLLRNNLSTTVNNTSSVINKPLCQNDQSSAKKVNQPVIIKRLKLPESKLSIEALDRELKSIVQQASNIPSSDYDVLEELMDDDLRQEIGELSSDEENFASPNIVPKASKEKTNVSKSTPTEATRLFDSSHVLNGSQNQNKSNKQTIPLLQMQSTIVAPVPNSHENANVMDNKLLHANGPLAASVPTSFETKNIIKNKPLHNTMYTPDNRKTQVRMQQTKSNISHHAANVMTSANDHLNQAKPQLATVDSSRTSNNIHMPSYVQQNNMNCNQNIINNRFCPPTTINQNTGNVYTTITQQPAVQNVVLIRPEIIYEQVPTVQVHQIPQSMNPTMCSVNSSAYVAVNAVPNISLYGTQFAAPIINPLIVGNTITIPVTQNTAMPVSNSCNNAPQLATTVNASFTSNPTFEKPSSAECRPHNNELEQNKINNTITNMQSHSINQEPAVKNVVDHNPKMDVKINVSSSNKNSERKVLSEVQEKHTINSSEKLNSKKSGLRIASEDEIKKDFLKTREEFINKKRTAILNRQVHVFSHTKPIPLTYTPIHVIKVVPETKEKQIVPDASVTHPHSKSQAITAIGLKSPMNVKQPPNNITVDIGNKINDLLIFNHNLKDTNLQSEHIINSKERKICDGLQENHTSNTKPEAIITLGVKSSSIPCRPVEDITTNYTLLDQKKNKKIQKILINTPNETNKDGGLNDGTTKDSISEVIALDFKSSSIEYNQTEDIAMNAINKNDDQKENKDVQALCIDGLNENNINDGLKQNSVTDTTECERIKLRSLNKFRGNSELPQEIQTIGKKIVKTKVRLKIKKSKNKKKEKTLSKIKKRLTKKKKSKMNKLTNKDVVAQVKEYPNVLENTTPEFKLNLDIEEQILGSIIPKNSSLFIDNLKTSDMQDKIKKDDYHCNVFRGKAMDFQIKNNSIISNNKNDCASNQDNILNNINEIITKACPNVNRKIKTSEEVQTTLQKKTENLQNDKVVSNTIPSKTTDNMNEDVIFLNDVSPSVSEDNDNQNITKSSQGSEPLNPKKKTYYNITTFVGDNNKCISSRQHAKNSPLEMLDKDKLNEYIKSNVKIMEVQPKEGDDPSKKYVSIRLPNGNSFKVTISGKLDIDIDVLFEDPLIWSRLINNIPGDACCVLNINQVGTKAANNIRTQLIYPQRKYLGTINLISDDEEDTESQAFKTEFGKYKIGTMKEDIFNRHQYKFSQKCVVKLQRYQISESNSSAEMENKNDIKYSTGNTCTSEHIILKEQDSFQSCALSVDKNEEIIEIDDSSNDSLDTAKTIHEDIISNEIKKNIKELKETLLKDLCVDEKDDVDMTETLLSVDEAYNESSDNISKDIMSKEPCSNDDDDDDKNLDHESEKSTDTNSNGTECKNESELKHKEPSTKKCQLKIKKCDDLVKKYQLLQISKGCFVSLKRCDGLIQAKSRTKKAEVLSELESENVEDIKRIHDDEVKSTVDTENDISPSNLKRSSSFSILNDFSLEDHSVKSLQSKGCIINSKIIEGKCETSEKEDYGNYKDFEKCHSDWYMTKLELHGLTRSECDNIVSDDVSTDCESDLDKSITDCLVDDKTTEVSEKQNIHLVPSLLNLTLDYLENTIDLKHVKSNKLRNSNNMNVTFINNLKRKSNSTSEDTPNERKILKLNHTECSNEASDSIESHQNFNQETHINSSISNIKSCDNNEKYLFSTLDSNQEINSDTSELSEMKNGDVQDVDREEILKQDEEKREEIIGEEDYSLNIEKDIDLNIEKNRMQDDNSVDLNLRENDRQYIENYVTKTCNENPIEQDMILPSVRISNDSINETEEICKETDCVLDHDSSGHNEEIVVKQGNYSYTIITDRMNDEDQIHNLDSESCNEILGSHQNKLSKSDDTQTSDMICTDDLICLNRNSQDEDSDMDTNSENHSNIHAYSDKAVMEVDNTILKPVAQDNLFCKDMGTDDLNCTQMKSNFVENDDDCLPVTSVALDSKSEQDGLEQQMEPVLKSHNNITNTRYIDETLPVQQYINVDSNEIRDIDNTETVAINPIVDSEKSGPECSIHSSGDLNEQDCDEDNSPTDDKIVLKITDSRSKSIGKNCEKYLVEIDNFDERHETIPDTEIQNLENDCNIHNDTHEHGESNILNNMSSCDKSQDKTCNMSSDNDNVILTPNCVKISNETITDFVAQEDKICPSTEKQVHEVQNNDLDVCKRDMGETIGSDQNKDYPCTATSNDTIDNRSIDVENSILRSHKSVDPDEEQHENCNTVKQLLENNCDKNNDLSDFSEDNTKSELLSCGESSNGSGYDQPKNRITKEYIHNEKIVIPQNNSEENLNKITTNFDFMERKITHHTEKQKEMDDESGGFDDHGCNYLTSVVKCATKDDQKDMNFEDSSGPKNITLLYENDSNIVLKGSIIEDPIVGTCYVFPIINSEMFTPIKNDNSENVVDNTSPNIYDTQNQSLVSKVTTKLVENIDLLVTKPKATYSKTGFEVNYLPKDSSSTDKARKCLKRKIEGLDGKINQKKYRKGKNIDYPKITVAAMCDCAYSKEFQKLSSYCSSIKFSYSKDYHLIQIEDVHTMLENWPIKQSHLPTIKITDTDTNLFMDKLPKMLPDPARQTLAEEISANYEEEEASVEEINETNFSMGFGEGSGRVIQNWKDGGESTKFSAATLSDVKQSQPFLLSVNKQTCDLHEILSSRHDELQKIDRCYSYIRLRNKVKTFFRETTEKLRNSLMNNYVKSDKIESNPNNFYDSMVDFLCDINSTNFFEPPFTESIVQVVQVGQLPVSAAAQNPVTCDPRVTQVSDASPAQCSVDNASNDDMQPGSKAEYTELTTADISLPLMPDYDNHQALLSGSQISNSPISNDNITIETEVKIEVLDEVPEDNMDEQSYYDNRDYTEFQSEQISNENEYTYDENNLEEPVKDEPDVKIVFEPLGNDLDNSEPADSYPLPQHHQQNGVHEKPDQLAHAMNAAGITTTSESMSDTAMDLSNTLPRSVCSNTDDNSYQRSTITALALQQALAQILPQSLNQSAETENNPPVSVASQILHIVHDKNSSINQLSSPDNTQPSMVNPPNPTPVLHIVQSKSGSVTSTSNGSPVHNPNSYNNLSLVDAGLSQGGNQLLHIVNTGNQKVNNTTQLLKRVNLLTNLANVQGSNEQKMVQFVCKSTDAKGIQLNTHQRSMVVRLHPIEPTTSAPTKPECQDQNINREPPVKEPPVLPPEIKSRSVYEENYAKFIQNSSKINIEKSTSLPKFNQAFGKPVFQEENQKTNEIVENTHLSSVETSIENDCQPDHSLQIGDNVRTLGSPPLLLRKTANQTSQAQQNLVQQIKQAITPMNIQTMHGGVIYTRQIPVNLGGGQTINLITVPNTDRVDDSVQKQKSDVKFGSRSEIEQSIIKIVPQSPVGSNAEIATDESNNSAGVSSESGQNSQPPPMLTQMRIKLPMLSKNTQMVTGGRVVRPSFFQIQRNVIGGANQPVYQQLVLTAAPTLGQQPIRLPQTQTNREMKVGTDTQTSPESQMSSSTLEQLREFDMVLEQVKERSTVQPNAAPPSEFPRSHTPSTSTSTDTTDNASSSTTPETTQQVLYSIGNNQSVNVAYINRKSTVVSSTATTSFARSPDSSGIVESPTSSSHVPTAHVSHTVTSETTNETHTPQSHHKPIKVSSKSKSRPKSHHPQFKINPVPPKPSNQKPMEDEQTTQRILYILAEYKEQVENSPDKDKPAPRRRTNLQAAPPGGSKRKKSGSRRSGRDSSPLDDNCRTMGSEDSSCGTSQGDCSETCLETHSPQGSPRKVAKKLSFDQDPSVTQQRPQVPRNVLVTDGPTLAVTRGAPGKPATAVLMPANYILPVSMVKSGQQIAIVTNRGPKILTVGGGENGATNALLLQRLIGPAGLKPMLARPGVRHVRLPTAAFHNLQAFNLTTATNTQAADSAASPAPATTPPDLIDTNTPRSPWTAPETEEAKPVEDTSPDNPEPEPEPQPEPEPEPWNVPQDYSYEETVRTEMDRTVLVVQRRDGVTNRHRLVSAATLRQKFALMEDELRLQKSLSEECEDLGVDSPSASELFPEAELLFSSSPAHESTQQSHTPQPVILNQSTTVPQPDVDDQVASDQLITEDNEAQESHTEIDLGLEDVGIVTVSEDGRATISLDHEEFVRSHPNTTFHSEPTDDGEIQAVTIDDLKARHITSTIFHASRAPATVLVSAPQTVISQATPGGGVDRPSPHSTPTSNSHVIRRLRYGERRDRTPRYLLDDTDHLIGSDSKMGDDSSATLDSIGDGDDDRSSPERSELFWESHTTTRSDNFSSDSDKCCKSPYDENNSTDSSGISAHIRLDSVIKDARGIGGDNVDDGNVPPLRTYPPKRTYHDIHDRSHSGRHHDTHDRSRSKPDDRFSDSSEGRRRASNRGVVKRGCHCCNGSPAPPKPKKPRQRKPTLDFN